ncbi:MAG TPA: aminodeoxychorismate lyase [Steroidobacteraceae bacterium]|jgi:4-amino-4-deoxychorismate lyase|nr:aminodeoxychorismate lyase [Steroidobacteraceae bacterium]
MADLEVVLIDGQPARVTGASVPVLERGLHYGDALFETIACVGGQPRLLERHLRRLTHGCGRLGLDPGDAGTLEREVRELAEGTSRSIIKLLLTRGAALARGYALTGHERGMRIALRYAWPAEDPAGKEEGVRVRLATVRLGENPALAGIKHCNRLEQVLARREWTDPGIAEALMFSSSGALVSGTMSNVFLVRGAKLLTPVIDRCGVAGVMRGLILELAAAAGIAAEERRLDAADLEAADELFLTNALTGIRPVSELAGTRRLRGAMTQRLQRELAAHLAAETKPGGSSA